MRLDRDRARLDALNVRVLSRHEEVILSRARPGDPVSIKERGRRVFDTDIALARDLGRSAGLLDRRLVGESDVDEDGRLKRALLAAIKVGWSREMP